ELISEHLRPGVVPLMRIEGFHRACLFDLWPDRALKWGVLSFLLRRGLADEGQAEHVATILDGVLRTRTESDFQRVSEALAQIQTRYPSVQSRLRLKRPLKEEAAHAD
ncbi:MAG: hypothetical protein AAGF12_38290, partial [Myxococcota bacterium]